MGRLGVARSKFFPGVAAEEDPYGPELVANPTFAASTGWVLNTGFSISDNKLRATSVAAGQQAHGPVFPENGKTYRVVLTVDSVSSGSIRFVMGSVVQTEISTPGTYTYTFTAIATDRGRVQSFAVPSTAEISFYSVKEVL